MKTFIRRFHSDEDGSYGLQVKLVGETDLECVFFDHLQRGHSIRLESAEKYGYNELRIIVENELLWNGERRRQGHKRNRK